MAGPSLARRATAIPVADVASLRPMWIRTTVVRLLLASLLLVVLALALVAARSLEPAKASFLPRDSSGVVVLDVSLSVTDPVFRRIHNALRIMSEGSDRVGLVVFSDVAYEMLPPGSAPEELKPILRFYKEPSGHDPGSGSEKAFPVSPWASDFSAGTRISAGLELAVDMLERDKVEHGSIVLVSDLDTAPSDRPTLAQIAASVKSKGIELRVVPLFAFAQDLTFFRRIIGDDNLITPPQLAARNRRNAESTLFAAKEPAALALLGALLLFLLAVNEWWGARIEVPRRLA
jgi:hypothetical protein